MNDKKISKENFSKQDMTRIWIALIQYRKYLDFIDNNSIGKKVRYSLLTKKVEQMMYAMED